MRLKQKFRTLIKFVEENSGSIQDLLTRLGLQDFDDQESRILGYCISPP